MWRPLHKAQQQIVGAARHWGCSHILFVEDDQWDFPHHGLDILLEHDKDVVGLLTYKKEFPFMSMCARRKVEGDSLLEQNLLAPYIGDGVDTVDLISFGFTLIKTDVFDRIDDPFALPYADHPADSYFSQYCDDAGIQKWIDFDHVVAHGNVAPREVPYMRMMHKMMDTGVPASDFEVPQMPEQLRQHLQEVSCAS